MRILWADDQEQVTDTLSGLAKPLNARIEKALDGEEAIGKLLLNDFDLLILDLMMTPGKWGGLWVLEEIGKRNLPVPVIVLSGEGTQFETIEALRLGARDYVIKENAQEELLDRIILLIEHFRDGFVKSAHTQLPAPLAIPYQRYTNTAEATSKLARLSEYFEAAFRFVCIVGICELKQIPEELRKTFSIRSNVLSCPTMGGWNSLRHHLARLIPSRSLFHRLNRSFDNGMANQIVKIRNDSAHGTAPSVKRAVQIVNEMGGEVDKHVKDILSIRNMRILLPCSLQFNGRSFTIEGNEIKGGSTVFPVFNLESLYPVTNGQVHIVVESEGGLEWTSLYPLLCLEQSMDPNSWHIMVFDGLETKAESRESEDPQIRYIDVWSGKRNESPSEKPRFTMLPEFLKGLQV